MKKSLFAVFLAVMLVTALVFVITPDATYKDDYVYEIVVPDYDEKYATEFAG